MKSTEKLHKAQTAVLNTLQYATRARYSELMRSAKMESDTFKFHIHKLVRLGYILKADDGLYELTTEGKAFASRLDKGTGREIEQPKSSMLMVVRCGKYVLAHRRDREPFNGYWGIASAPVLRGVPLAESAARELKKQTGIDAKFRVAGSYRVIDVNHRNTVLEDKIFALMIAELDRLVAPCEWSGGYSEWMSLEKLLRKDRLFTITPSIFEMISIGIPFREDVCVYSNDEY